MSSKSIAILGASGAVGSALAAQILRSQLLTANDRLQLVGRGSAASEGRLLGTRVDLLDAFDDEQIDVEVVPKIMDVDADIVVIASGVGMSPQCRDRREMGFQNREIFEHIADRCAQFVPNAMFIVVSNPVELAVQILASKVNPSRVVGMGAQQDSLRFSRAIARDLGISRGQVRASVAGEHGQAMVPLWSSVELLSPTTDLQMQLQNMKKRSAEVPLRERVAALQARVTGLLEEELIPEAYEAASRELPDARIFVEPFITAHTMRSTPNATANATLQCLAAVVDDDYHELHGQVLLRGEVLDLNGVCGVPITLSRDGWRHCAMDWLSEEERSAIIQSSNSINSFAAAVLS
jgi:malate dehydrogenase